MNIIHKPLHPGEIVKDALFSDTPLTVTQAAKQLRVDRSTLSRLLHGHAGISADMAHRLAIFLGTSPEMWLNLQRDYDLYQSQKLAKRLHIKPLSSLLVKAATC